MKDIAREFGISVATVSRALKDSPRISEERRKAIQQYAREPVSIISIRMPSAKPYATVG